MNYVGKMRGRNTRTRLADAVILLYTGRYSMTPAHFSFSLHRGADFATGWQLLQGGIPIVTDGDTFRAQLRNSAGAVLDTPNILQATDTTTNLTIPAASTSSLPLQTLRLVVDWHRHDGAVIPLLIGRVAIF